MPGEILVFVENQGAVPRSGMARPAWEALAAGQQLSRDTGAGVAGVLVGSSVSSLAPEVARAKLQELLTVEAAELAEYTSDGTAAVLAEIIRQRKPSYVVFSHTYQVRDFAPKLAASLGSALISDCLGYRKEGEKLTFVRQVFQGKFSADVEFAGDPPYLVSFQAAAFREDSLQRGDSPAAVTSIPAKVAAIRTKPGERFREARQAVDLTQAEIIVAVGRGIKAPENLEMVNNLAAALGGEVGASRPICDSGWLPMDRQIGSSGQTVAPKLYLGLGVSGAIQHQVGMKGSRVIVAINKDKEAPIFEVATYGIVADLFEVVPPLLEEIKKLKGA
ncbi:MAG: electron transfer flavoprotein subunit alpha/FixB family protein [Deltaproteobacteria bacterium]